MALLRDYELPGTGLIASNAYHVVTNVKVEKRMADFNVCIRKHSHTRSRRNKKETPHY
jgi:hypothetical protein